jgi:ubiquinone/menaquinone biosynthesis C-methylase UbiE
LLGKRSKFNKVDLISKYIHLKSFKFLLKVLVIPFSYFCFFKLVEKGIALRYLGSVKNKLLIDIGCGCGEFSLGLSSKGGVVVGVDIDKKAIIIAKNLSSRGCNFILADAQKLPFRSNVFDAICSLSCLEHVTNDDEAIKEMVRIVKSKGVVVLTVDTVIYKDLSFRSAVKKYKIIHYYHLQQLINKLKRHGLKITKGEYYIKSRISMFLYQLCLQDMRLNPLIFALGLYSTLILDSFLLRAKMIGCELAVRCEAIKS